jgi:hypothetical protein
MKRISLEIFRQKQQESYYVGAARVSKRFRNANELTATGYLGIVWGRSPWAAPLNLANHVVERKPNYP